MEQGLTYLIWTYLVSFPFLASGVMCVTFEEGRKSWVKKPWMKSWCFPHPSELFTVKRFVFLSSFWEFNLLFYFGNMSVYLFSDYSSTVRDVFITSCSWTVFRDRVNVQSETSCDWNVWLLLLVSLIVRYFWFVFYWCIHPFTETKKEKTSANDRIIVKVTYIVNIQHIYACIYFIIYI